MKSKWYAVVTMLVSLPSFGQVTDMETYLEQVRTANFAYKGSSLNREGAKNLSAQAELITSFRIDGSYQQKKDQKLSQNPALTYDEIESESLSVGVARKTSFGLDARLSFDASDQEFINPSAEIPGGSKVNTSTPTFTFTQSLWQNGFGSLTKAQIEASLQQSELDRQNAETNLDLLIQKAIAAYWNLVLQKEVVEIQKAALNQSELIYEYNAKRARMNLVDRADSLQAKATVEAKKLELQTAMDAERIRIREFNLYRNSSPLEDPGKIAPVDWEIIPKINLPKTRGDRADVKAARAQSRVSAASSRIIE